MITVRNRLRSAQTHLNDVRWLLERALQLATEQGYDTRWQDAISAALRLNHAAYIHINNIAILLTEPDQEPMPVHRKSTDPGKP